MFVVNPCSVGWRLVDGCAVIVHRTSGALYRLNRPGTLVWQALTEDHPFLQSLFRAGLVEATSVGSAAGRPGFSAMSNRGRDSGETPRCHPVAGIDELVADIAVSSDAIMRRVGDVAVLRLPDAGLFLPSPEALALWQRLELGPCAFVDGLDLLCALGHGEAEARNRLIALLREFEIHGALEGTGDRWKPRLPVAQLPTKAVEPSSASDLRPLGKLQLMQYRQERRDLPNLNRSPVMTDITTPPQTVAIVCQYGILGLAPGIESYVQRCIRRLKALNPDLIVLTGGGRHGLAKMREAESIAQRYEDHFPSTPIWIETYSGTSWANVAYSLDMLSARAIVPQRLVLIGDRARTEKLRLTVWLAKRRFPVFRDVPFHVIPETRDRVTWRDWRMSQFAVGWLQVLNESNPSVRLGGTSQPISIRPFASVTGTVRAAVRRWRLPANVRSGLRSLRTALRSDAKVR